MKRQYPRTNKRVILFTLLLISLLFSGSGKLNSLAALSVTQSSDLPGPVYKSTDSGMTWTTIDTGIAGQLVHVLASHPQMPATLYAGTNRGVFKTTDAGNHWHLSTGIISLYRIYGLAVDPANPANLFAAGNGAGGNYIFKSTDAGLTWKAVSLGFNDSVLAAVLIHPNNPAILYARDELRVYRSTDGGDHWNIILTTPSLDFHTPADLKLDPLTPSTLYWASAHRFYKTIDGGNNWVEMGELFYDLGVRPWGFTIDPVHPSVVYAQTDAGILLKSTDGGDSWASHPNKNSLPVYNLTIDPAEPSTLYTTLILIRDRRRSLFKSTNGGSDWFETGLSSAETFIDLTDRYDLKFDPANPSIIYAATNGGVESTDTPWIRRFLVEDKKLFVFGDNFDTGAVILLDGEEQVTKNDKLSPRMKLVGKSAGKRVKKNPDTRIRIRNATGKLSQEVTPWPPLN
jgi:hypothetical protein